MRLFTASKELGEKLEKLSKKDRVLYDAFWKKTEEILNGATIDHYKNLRKPLQDFKRVHVTGSFVLVFSYTPSDDKVFFVYLDHHDVIYKKKKFLIRLLHLR